MLTPSQQRTRPRKIEPRERERGSTNPTKAMAVLYFLLLSLWAILQAAPGNSQVANGFTNPPYQVETWAGNVTGARGLVVDDVGDVLVVATGLGGIYALWEEADGQVNRTQVVNNSNLNHGIFLYGDHLYASSSTTVWRWSYRAGQRSAASGQETVVVDISQNESGLQTTDGHATRSLAIDSNGILYVSVGSTSNVDSDSFRARIRSFNISAAVPQEFVADGVVFADGLRNEVGLGFDGSGRLWGVENGADNLDRADLGGDIHDDNPAEELNLFDGSSRFYGYPFCWSEFKLPKFGTGPGSQWAWPSLENGTITDAWCKDAANVRPPELAMQAHSAPLGIAFYNGSNCGTQLANSSGEIPRFALACNFSGDAFVAFHGSWDREVPVGFKVVRIAFDNGTGLPVSKDAAEAVFDIFGAKNSQTDCAGDARGTCLRPVDVKFDKSGALLVTSDATGDIFRVTLSSGDAVAAPAPTPAPSSAPRFGPSLGFGGMALPFVPLLTCQLWWHLGHFI